MVVLLQISQIKLCIHNRDMEWSVAARSKYRWRLIWMSLKYQIKSHILQGSHLMRDLWVKRVFRRRFAVFLKTQCKFLCDWWDVRFILLIVPFKIQGCKTWLIKSFQSFENCCAVIYFHLSKKRIKKKIKKIYIHYLSCMYVEWMTGTFN